MMNPFALAYREQQQLFLYDWKYIAGVLFKTGGLSALIARFLVQFFYMPWLAVTITVFLALAASFLAWIPFRKSWQLIPLSLLAGICVLYLSSDNLLHYDAIISYILALSAIAAYSAKPNHVAGLVYTILLWFTAGPAAFLFAVTAFLLDIARQRNLKSMAGLSYIAVSVILGYVSWSAGSIATFPAALTPAFFYELTVKIPTMTVCAWFLLPAVILICAIMEKFCKSRYIGLGISALVLLVAGFFIKTKADSLSTKADLDKYRFEHYASNCDWTALEKATDHELNIFNTANYYNLAKAMQGTLADDLFKYVQHTPNSLIFMPQGESSDPRFARVLFAMGNMPAAQNIAFNSLPSFCGYNHDMLMMLTQIELMRGSYDVAEKYLDILSKSMRYRGWAKEMSKFLGSDELVEKDPVLGNGRKNLASPGKFVLDPSSMDDILSILKANPSDKMAMQYGLSFLLLAKDFNNTFKLIDAYYGTPCLESLPVPAQEALVFFSDYYHTTTEEYAVEHGISAEDYESYQKADLDYCLAHGVSEDTVRRFSEFKDAYGQGAQSAIASTFRHTFWYYLLYENI